MSKVEAIERYAAKGVKFCSHGLSDSTTISGVNVADGAVMKIKRYAYFCSTHNQHGSFAVEEVKMKNNEGIRWRMDGWEDRRPDGWNDKNPDGWWERSQGDKPW